MSDEGGQWATPLDVLKLAATTPADQAFRPMSEGGCSLVKS